MGRWDIENIDIVNKEVIGEIEFLKDEMSKIGIELTDKQICQFILYYDMLIEKNKVMNLTGITDFKEVVRKHFVDSLSIVRVYDLNRDIKILDLGTGAGFPGIPIKIVFSNTKIVLLDSLMKRLKFLDEVIEKLELENIYTIHGRAEDFGHDNEYREQFDCCVSRAVAKLASLSEYCMPYVKVGGYFIPYKAKNLSNEVLESKKAISVFGGKIEKVEEFTLPGTDMDRSFIVVKKIGKIPKQYPRLAGKPVGEPIM